MKQRPRDARFRAGVAAVLAVVPRAAPSYAAYVFAPLLMFDFKRTPRMAWVRLFALLFAATVSLLISATIATVSYSAFVIELILLAPLLVFVSGFGFASSGVEGACARALRLMNAIAAVLSLFNVALRGLPYVQRSPDVLGALFGLGGSRIVTMIGFFGVVYELARRTELSESYSLWFLVALFNFFAPSYILGIVCGIAAIAVWRIRSVAVFVILAIASAPSLWYALVYRLRDVNDLATSLTGQNPKAFAYESVWRVFTHWPALLFFGTGPGQFSSTPQNWVDPGLRAISAQSVPPVPGLRLSTYHQVILTPYTDLGLQYPYALSSSVNKPYTGLATIVVEWGVVGCLILWLLFRRVRRLARTNSAAWAPLIFFLALNGVDMWHDSPWLALGLVCIGSMSDDSDQVVSANRPHAVRSRRNLQLSRV